MLFGVRDFLCSHLFCITYSSLWGWTEKEALWSGGGSWKERVMTQPGSEWNGAGSSGEHRGRLPLSHVGAARALSRASLGREDGEQKACLWWDPVRLYQWPWGSHEEVLGNRIMWHHPSTKSSLWPVIAYFFKVEKYQVLFMGPGKVWSLSPRN